MFEGNLYFIIKLLPVLAIVALAFGCFGWWLRCKLCKCGATKEDLGQAHSKVAELEAALKKAQSAAPAPTKKSKSQEPKENPIDPKVLEDLQKQVTAAKAEADSQRQQAQKAREALDAANARATEAVKGPQERIFALESEISKAREEAARARAGLSEAGPDTEAMATEVARLKQSLASATAGFGKMQRERDALAAEIDKLKGNEPSATKTKMASESGPSGPNPEAARQKVLGLQQKRGGPLSSAARVVVAPPPPAPESPVKPISAKTEVPAEKNVESPSVVVSDPPPAAEIKEPVVDEVSAPEEIVKPETVEEAVEQPVEQPAPVEPVAEVEAETPAAVNSLLGSGLLPGMGGDEPLAPGMKDLAASDVMGKKVLQDDLKLVEGIGPKIEELFKAAGIETWAVMSETTAERLKEILTAAGERFVMHDPTTWPQQAGLMAAGKWDEVKKLQDELDGGR